MNKLLLAFMSVMIVLCLPIYSMAAGDTTITQDTEEKSGKINIDYSVEENYIVVIPASVTFTDAEKSIDRALEVRNVILSEGSTLNVNIASLNDFMMKNGEGYIEYKIYINYYSIPEKSEFTILSVKAGEPSGWAILNFVTDLEKTHALYAGKYTDTLTFTVSVD